MATPTSLKAQIKKLARFTEIYGFRRALNKSISRLRLPWLKAIYFWPRKQTVSIIGCGQFAFSCISFYLKNNRGRIFLECYDPDEERAQSMANYYRYQRNSKDADTLLSNPELEVLYIASNHYTHAGYASQAMSKGIKQIYMEKPIAVNYEQFVDLLAHQKHYGTTLYAGYNRPYSDAIQLLAKKVLQQGWTKGGMSINFFISGHLLPLDHWYRIPREGTRICGNVGHWIDLAIHMMAWRGLPEKIKLSIAYSNTDEPDDNITISMTTDQNDLISMMLTSRTDPFEGINETISYQFNDIIAKVDDFRRMTIWHGEELQNTRFLKKDIGHERAVLQPYKSNNRNWEEVKLSTALMLHITDMVVNKITTAEFDVPASVHKLENDTSKRAETFNEEKMEVATGTSSH